MPLLALLARQEQQVKRELSAPLDQPAQRAQQVRGEPPVPLGHHHKHNGKNAALVRLSAYKQIKTAPIITSKTPQ